MGPRLFSRGDDELYAAGTHVGTERAPGAPRLAWTAERLRLEEIAVDSVIHNGVPIREARPPLPNEPIVGYAGRLVRKKGVDTLLRAFAGGNRPEARLVLCGDGPERQPLEALARELGIAAHVEFTGHLDRDAMEAALAGAWVRGAPSRWEEPFGLVAAEAAMRGTAAVVSRRGGLAEQVIEGETGHTFENEDVGELAHVLDRLLRDRERCESLGAAGRRHALAHFTEQHTLDRFRTLYTRLLAPTTPDALTP